MTCVNRAPKNPYFGELNGLHCLPCPQGITALCELCTHKNRILEKDLATERIALRRCRNESITYVTCAPKKFYFGDA